MYLLTCLFVNIVCNGRTDENDAAKRGRKLYKPQ